MSKQVHRINCSLIKDLPTQLFSSEIYVATPFEKKKLQKNYEFNIKDMFLFSKFLSFKALLKFFDKYCPWVNFTIKFQFQIKIQRCLYMIACQHKSTDSEFLKQQSYFHKNFIAVLCFVYFSLYCFPLLIKLFLI